MRNTEAPDAWTPRSCPRAPASRGRTAGLAPPRAAPDLVDRLIARDEAAFEELVRTRGPRLLALAARYLPHAADAEDALQDSFVAVVRSVSQFKRTSSLDTWLHRIVVNSALMILRRRRRKPETALGMAAEVGGVTPWRRRPCPSAHEVAANEELKRGVCRSAGRLPEAQRSVLRLHDLEGLELTAIAELLGVGVSTVKSRLHRARHALQGALAPP